MGSLFHRWFTSLDWYGRATRGFWLLCLSSLPVFFLLLSLDDVQLSDSDTRLTLVLAPLFCFVFGSLPQPGAFARVLPSALLGSLVGLASGAFLAWFGWGADFTEIWSAHNQSNSYGLALGSFLILGTAWGVLCWAAQRSHSASSLAYVIVDMAAPDAAAFSLSAAQSAWPAWAAGARLERKSEGSWRVSFEAERDFFLFIEFETSSEDIGDEYDDEHFESTESLGATSVESPCLIGLVWTPSFSLHKAFSPASTGVDVLVMREAFITAFARSSGGVLLSPIA